MISQHDNLATTVLNLIQRKSEGEYWDFKRQHHDNNAELIHDVLCLANAGHEGQRYLIFGVDDSSHELQSITETAGRKSQADIVSLFRDNAHKFFQTRTPNLYMTEVQFGEKSLDVLVIEDGHHKPYHLVEDYRIRSKTVRAQHVYTRQNDTNTPMNGVAPPHEIERMWRERLGLDKTPLEKAQRYLEDPEAWDTAFEGGAVDQAYQYHRQFPEFTLRTAQTREDTTPTDEWTRGEIVKDNNSAFWLSVHYHQTMLEEVLVATFDDSKKRMVIPDWKPRGAGRFYFYDEQSMRYTLQRFLSKSRFLWVKKDDSKNLAIGYKAGAELSTKARATWIDGYLQIPVLRTQDLENFMGPKRGYIEPSTDYDEQYQIFIRNQIDFEEWRNNVGQR